MRTISIDLMNEPCKGDFAYLYRIHLHFLLPPQLTYLVCKVVSWLSGYEGSSAVLFRVTRRIQMSIVPVLQLVQTALKSPMHYVFFRSIALRKLNGCSHATDIVKNFMKAMV